MGEEGVTSRKIKCFHGCRVVPSTTMEGMADIDRDGAHALAESLRRLCGAVAEKASEENAASP
ncbi:hypothetical protein Pta02_65990 [Planobispora takensis]|uniref:Uncharacterized protein n=1 Tax=Planobispora takensis TaxID=1367882 RepID=A0A8J3T534_9ACTN|nr:hypothetical protein Pta02_65990 [Planobispora takensis]